MNTQAYALGDKYYLPERVFFRNLFNYCQCRTEDFLEKIKAVMEREIEESVESLLTDIEYAEKLEEKTVRGKQHLLSTDFLSYVKNEHEKQHRKASNYSLTNYYKRISFAASNACQHSNTLAYKPIKITEDKKALELFQTLYQDAEPLSLRELNRVLEPTGTPQTSRGTGIHAYSKNQDAVVVFTIQKVIPDIFKYAERSLLSLLSSRSWHDIVCKYQTEKGFPSCVVEIDPATKEEFEDFMCNCFDELKKIAMLSQEDQDADDIGKLLLKMYDKIVTEHRDGKIQGLPDQRAKHCKCFSAEENALPPADNEIYQYDSLVSMHITNLMEWARIAREDNHEFMKYIDRIIEKIRVHILKQIDTTFTVDELRNLKRESEPGNSLFLWHGNENLLRLLIHAIHDESIVLNALQMGGQHE